METSVQPKKSTRRTRESQEKREIIFTKAMQLFRTHGYDNVSVQDISRETGMSVGSIYHFFGKKIGILMYAGKNLSLLADKDTTFSDGVLKDAYTVLYNAFFDLATRFDNEIGRETTRKLTASSMEIFDKSGVCHIWAKSSDELKNYIGQAQRAGALTSDYPPETIAFFLDSFIEGLIHEWCFHNRGDTLASLVSEFCPIALRFFSVKEEPVSSEKKT